MMHEKNRLVKHLKIENFSVSIGRATIEYQSSQAESNQKFYRNFDRSSSRFDRLKIWKNQFIKTEHFNAETPQSTLYYK